MNLDPPEYRKAPPGKVCPRCLESSVYDGECTVPGCVPADEPTIEDISGIVEDFTDGASLADWLEDMRRGREESSSACPECGQEWCGCYLR